MKRFFTLSLAMAAALWASDVQYVMTAIYGRGRGAREATAITIYDEDTGVTGYQVTIDVCHPTQHGCIMRRESQYAGVEGNFGIASVVFDVPLHEVRGEPEIVALPGEAKQ